MEMLQSLHVNKNILKQFNKCLGKDYFERFKQLSGLSKNFKNLNKLLNSSNDILKPINNDKEFLLHEKLKEYTNKLILAERKEYRLEKIKEHQKEDITLER